MRTFAVAAALLAFPVPAFACWDGFHAHTDRVTFTGEGDEAWSAEQVRDLANWTRRFEVLLGADGTLESDMGYGSVCIGERCSEVVVRSMRPQALFSAVATALHVPWMARAAALGVDATPYAVQVAASRDRAAADALAARLSGLDLPMGFVEIGGFPADNPEAHVIDGVDGAGLPVYRIVVGAFLDRAEASAHADEIAQATGMPTVLRAL